MESFKKELIANANKLCTPGKGILAADESTGTIGKRFQSINLENTEANRRAYRNLLFTTAGSWQDYVSGVILYEETLYQKSLGAEEVEFTKLLADKGILSGIKLDKGTVVLHGTNNETATQGLDGLAERCKKYYAQGARFAKWRNVLTISANTPSHLSLVDMAQTLSRYATICQENGLVPIIEPETLMDGTHSIERCAEATELALTYVINAMHEHHVLFEGCVLKPNMVCSGEQSGVKDTPETVAHYTVRTLQRCVPPAIPGIFFLSGGQNEEEATLNLNAMNQYPGKRPWHLSFSYGRALQHSCIKAWAGKPENVEKAQEVFFARAKANGEAQLGKYKGDAASAASTVSLYEKGYVY